MMTLDENDWAALFGTGTVQIGRKTIDIRPFGIKDLAVVIKRIDRIKKKIPFEDLDLERDMDRIAAAITEDGLDLLELATGIDRNDLERMPLAKLSEIAAETIRVNIESQQSLIKNLKALTSQVAGMVQGARGSATQLKQ